MSDVGRRDREGHEVELILRLEASALSERILLILERLEVSGTTLNDLREGRVIVEELHRRSVSDATKVPRVGAVDDHELLLLGEVVGIKGSHRDEELSYIGSIQEVFTLASTVLDISPEPMRDTRLRRRQTRDRRAAK